MENNRRWNLFWAFLLAAVLSFGGVGCIATGFLLKDVNLGVLLLNCVGVSLIWAVACRYRFGVPIASAAIVIAWLLPNARSVIESEKVLLYKITSAYNRGYGWPVLYWDDGVPSVGADNALLLIACIVSLVIVWTVFRQKKAVFTAIVSFLPLMSCLVLTDTVPENEYLMLMVGGLLLLALTNPIRRMDAKQASRATAFLLVPVMLVTVGLFWVAPRDGYTPNESAFSQLEQWLQENELWQKLTGAWYAGDSGADEVSLDTLGGKSDSDSIALYVTSEKGGYLYLRGRGYDTYDGKHWTASRFSSGVDRGWGYTFGGAPRVTVRMNAARDFYYFSGTSGPGSADTRFEYGMLPNKDGEKTYTFPWGTPAGAKSIAEVYQACLVLPEETAAWAKDVLKTSVLSGLSLRPSREAIASRIADAVRNCAEYSLDPEKMPLDEQDFAKWFFTEAESGYCVHFATTATVLLRAAGIPARYVTGYALGVTSGKEIAVTQSRAHAWVEYYDNILGWTVLDPTPGYNDPVLPTEPTTEPTETTAPTQPSSRPTEPTQETTQPTLPAETQPNTPTRPTPGTQEKNGAWQTVLAVLIQVILLCAVVWGQYLARVGIRRWYLHRGGTNQQALARWRSVRIRSRIFRQKPPQALRELAEKAKYSQHTLTDGELRKFDLHMTALAAKLQEKTWLLRWLLRLFWAIE